MSGYNAYVNRAFDYFKKHPNYNATIHVIGGMAIGILITYPFIGAHPLRWGLTLGAISSLGNVYAFLAKK